MNVSCAILFYSLCSLLIKIPHFSNNITLASTAFHILNAFLTFAQNHFTVFNFVLHFQLQFTFSTAFYMTAQSNLPFEFILQLT